MIVTYDFSKLPAVRAERRGWIVSTEEAMKPLAELFPFTEELSHHFAPSLYARYLLVPKGSRVIGKIHKHEHLYVVAGHCRIFTEFGETEVDGFKVLTSHAGEKRAWLALEDTHIVTFHPTNETDLDKIEADVIAENYEVIE